MKRVVYDRLVLASSLKDALRAAKYLDGGDNRSFLSNSIWRIKYIDEMTFLEIDPSSPLEQDATDKEFDYAKDGVDASRAYASALRVLAELGIKKIVEDKCRFNSETLIGVNLGVHDWVVIEPKVTHYYDSYARRQWENDVEGYYVSQATDKSGSKCTGKAYKTMEDAVLTAQRLVSEDSKSYTVYALLSKEMRIDAELTDVLEIAGVEAALKGYLPFKSKVSNTPRNIYWVTGCFYIPDNE